MLSHQLMSIVIVAFVMCIGLGFAQSQQISQPVVICIAVVIGLVFILGMKQTQRWYDSYKRKNRKKLAMQHMQARAARPTSKMYAGIGPKQETESMPVGQPGVIGKRVNRYHGEVEMRNQAKLLKTLAFID